MKLLYIKLDGTAETARAALGGVVCAAVRSHEGKRLFDKGHLITERDLPLLLPLRGVAVPLVMPAAEDLHENAAALRLAHAAAGPGVDVVGPVGAKARLTARHNGLLHVDAETLDLMNSVGSVSIFTLFDGQPVGAGTVVAEAKVTPLVVPADDVERSAGFAAAPPISVLPFKPFVGAALIREKIAPIQAKRMAEGLEAKLNWFGSQLSRVQYLPEDASPQSIGAAMRKLTAGANLIFATGGSATDPADSLLNALPYVPARLERTGIPAHPGSLLWLAYAGDVPILGVPSCGMFSEATSLDLVLPLLLSGQPLTSATFAGMGHGGLLTHGDWRFPPYRK